MNEQQLAAVKLALGALECIPTSGSMLGTYAEQKRIEAIADLQSIISQDALYKMAEESRTSGLRLDDWDKIGCVNHDCDKCRAVQEPVAWRYDLAKYRENDLRGRQWAHSVFSPTKPYIDEMVRNLTPLYTTPPAPQPVPVKTYHDGKPWPVQPKPWMGLTDDDIHEQGWNLSADRDYEAWTGREFLVVNGVNDFARAIEAKLKEKNT